MNARLPSKPTYALTPHAVALAVALPNWRRASDAPRSAAATRQLSFLGWHSLSACGHRAPALARRFLEFPLRSWMELPPGRPKVQIAFPCLDRGWSEPHCRYPLPAKCTPPDFLSDDGYLLNIPERCER